jgi:predicted AAA+ superfamily ATPase
MIDRIVNPLKQNSFFLFGARGTGKSFLLNHLLTSQRTLKINLLDPVISEQFALEPSRLVTAIDGFGPDLDWVFIDEIQKQPKLLDLVHLLIEERSLKFAITGSSARKLKHGAANMLAGRAFEFQLFPLTHLEIGQGFSLDAALHWGTLPSIITASSDENRRLYLQSYSSTYLKEEIAEEQVVRKLDPFRKFLNVAAQSNGTIINFSKIARDVGVSTVTVQSYFQILEDTLLGFYLQPFHNSVRKRQRGNPKFYLFDLGIQRALSLQTSVPLVYGNYAYGRAFEHFIVAEIFRLQRYLNKDFQLSYLRTKDDAEIDLIIERPGLPMILIEIKSSNQIRAENVRSLQRFLPDFKNAKAICLSNDPTPQKIGEVWALPWKKGLEEIGLVSQ